MKRILPVLMITSVFFVACNSDENSDTVTDKYEKTKETLGQTEKKNPLRFLSVAGNDRKNLIRQTVIKGTISNNATIASYKDVDVEISFYSKTGALLLKDHEVIYETIAPGNSFNFKTKILAPAGSDSLVLKIYSAKTD